MSKSFGRRPKRAQMHPKRTPESFHDQRRTQRGSKKISRREPEAPEAFQKLDEARIIEKPIGV